MPNGIWAVAMTAAMQVGAPGPSETPNFPPLQNAYNQYGFEGQYEQRYPVDTQQNWVHGYRQEIPAYGGHPFFRPYNYKDILSQSQVSAGWGQSPVLPYSQQFWHKYHDQATMLKLSRMEALPQAPQAVPAQPVYYNPAGLMMTRPVEPLPAPPAAYYLPNNYVPNNSFGAPPVQNFVPQTVNEVSGPNLQGPAFQPAVSQQYYTPAPYAPR